MSLIPCKQLETKCGEEAKRGRLPAAAFSLSLGSQPTTIRSENSHKADLFSRFY
jgi:hypothetical protein